MTCEAVMNKRSVGSIYEQLAAEQLINMGYSVLACNYRNRFGEIDIIAKDGDTTVSYTHLTLPTILRV